MSERSRREDAEGGMTAEQFAAAGIRLFGAEHWQEYMARAIGRDKSMIWRYATDTRRIPLVVEMSVAGLLAMDRSQRAALKRRIKVRDGKLGRPKWKKQLKPRVKSNVDQRRAGGEPGE